MTLGPPPSAAGPSNSSAPDKNTDVSSSQAVSSQPGSSSAHLSAPAPGPSVSTGPYTSQFAVQPQPATRSYYGGPHTTAFAVTSQAGASTQAAQSYTAQTGYYAQPGAPQPAGNYSYYSYPPNAWANAWNTSSYQYPSGGSYPYPYTAPQQSTTLSQPSPQAVSAPQQRNEKTPTPSPSPSPPPEYHKDWDAIIKSFLSSMGFTQALRGFEADMVVLNAEWERKKVPDALAELMKSLLRLGQARPEGDENTSKERPLEERKLDYVHLANGATPRSQTSITKDISRFLAQNRARNDASNRNEFLLSIAEKRRKLNDNGDSVPSPSISSCARTDAKTQNRDLQMKYDIAKNEDGPLRRTMKNGQADTVAAQAGNKSNIQTMEDYPSAQRHPALDERLQNVEKHLAIRYVPSPPRSLLDRLKYLEDHIIHLEREYPPWAALHFNQPNRGWPPPPRATPIVVPSYLTSTKAQADDQQPPQPSTSASDTSDSQRGKGKQTRHTQSSLHRAVLEKLEVQKAMNDPH